MHRKTRTKSDTALAFALSYFVFCMAAVIHFPSPIQFSPGTKWSICQNVKYDILPLLS